MITAIAGFSLILSFVHEEEAEERRTKSSVFSQNQASFLL
jgi:hypothetical protein